METAFKSIFCAAVLLLMCRLFLDVQSIRLHQDTPDYSIGWSTQTPVEEDSKEFEDDDFIGDFTQPPTGLRSGMSSLHFRLFDLSELVREVVAPPPQG